MRVAGDSLYDNTACRHFADRTQFGCVNSQSLVCRYISDELDFVQSMNGYFIQLICVKLDTLLFTSLQEHHGRVGFFDCVTTPN